MSLHGRRFFDALSHRSSIFSSRLRLPCPPYSNPLYWDNLYRKMDPDDDVHEWGGFDLESLLKFRHEDMSPSPGGKEDGGGGEVRESTFGELMMGISRHETPDDAVARYEETRTEDGDVGSAANESILVVGSGTSRLGEQILSNSFVGPVLQVDISSLSIKLLRDRYKRYLEGSRVRRMELITDDCRQLSSLEPESVGGGAIDKGLIDVLHLDGGRMEDWSGDAPAGAKSLGGEDDPIGEVVDSVHRVLRPGRPFVFFSRSGPEYILRRTLRLGDGGLSGVGGKWSDVDVFKLVDLDMILYRFVKAETKADDGESYAPIRMGRVLGRKGKRKRK